MMIRNDLPGRIVCAILMITLVLLFGCKKDENKLGAVNRITKLSYFENDKIQWIYDYAYKNEKMTATDITIYIDGSPHHSNWEINYPSDDSIVSYFKPSADSPTDKQILILQNGLVIRKSVEDYVNPGIWKTDRLFEYSYLNDLVTEEVEYYGGEGSTPDPYKKSTFEYEGNKLVRTLHYTFDGDWVLKGLDSIIYSGDKLDMKIDYDFSTGTKTESKKYIYFYEDSLLTQMDYSYRYVYGDWSDVEKYFLSYNEFGNLTERSAQPAPGAVVKYVYEYEGGIGNYRQFNYPIDDFWSPLILPTPN
jgi:hypothetical protein